MNESFSRLHHICIVVRDIDSSVRYYESLNIGPWHDFPSLETFRGHADVPSDDFFALRYKYADLGNVQLQLCEPPAGDTPQRRFLDEHGEGVFHLGFAVPDLDDAEPKIRALGPQPSMRARLANGAGFTYFDTAGSGAGVTLQIRSSGQTPAQN